MQIALLGNPNTGKSSIFNLLTGMRQHVGNFPGVTVDKKTGVLALNGENHTLIDYPGTYSIYPRSADEEVVYDTLYYPTAPEYPDVAVVVVDASNLRRNLFLYSQIYDLGIPTVMILNMSDLALKNGVELDLEKLQNHFPNAIFVTSNARVGLGKERIFNAISEAIENKKRAKQYPRAGFLPNFIPAEKLDLAQQEREAEERYKLINQLVKTVETKRTKKTEDTWTNKLDKIFIHPVWGYLIFAGVLMIIFQFIFAFASIPMDFIDSVFGNLSQWTSNALPAGVFNDLLSQGIIPGIGGVAIFIPQIALLFFFISILEETGYFARVVFIMDRLMRPFGLNGKSVVPLISSVACAIPGVMAARTISDWKERLITIMVAPLMSCSARIPVYTLLIALVIPDKSVLGFNLQGLVLFGLYFLGIIAAIVVAIILKWFIRSKDKGFLLLELPSYKQPRWGNVGITVYEKVRVFVFDAGKVILAISIILWALASYGPSERMENASKKALHIAKEKQLNKEETEQYVASAKLENSFIGIMGKAIEPVIKPLGYDWKIGISLITSFAAREVFVGSLATIYAVQDDGDANKPLIEKLRQEKRADGTPVYTLASGLSLMVFYVFAMQCMATLAVVKRETKSWKWPLIQMGYMGAMAYLFAMITFYIFS